MDKSFLQSTRLKGGGSTPQGGGSTAPKQDLASWLDDFEQDNAPPQRPASAPESIADQLNMMPNSEKLSPIERLAYKHLPGFAESSVGKALASFGESAPGKLLAKLDVLAEGLERTLGMVAQFRDRDPDEEFKFKDAWTAGSLYYDTVRLPRFQYGEDGKVLGLQMDTDMPGAYAVTEARHLIEQGKTLEEVRELLYNNMGALAMRSQMQDTLGHIALDPLNWAFGILKPVDKLHAIRNLALTGKIDPSAVKAMEAAARMSGDLESANKFAQALVEAEKSGKAMTLLDRFAINITGGVPYLQKGADGAYELYNAADKSGNWLHKVNIFKLSPQARASEMLDMVAANVGEHLIRPNWHKDPEEFIRAVSGAARGAIGNEWGHVAMTVQGRTVQAVLSESDVAMRALGQEWAVYSKERNLLRLISGHIPGQDERRLWKLAKTSPELFMKKVLEAAKQPGAEALLREIQLGNITPDFVKTINKIDNHVPLLREEFYTKALVTIQDTAMRQSILQFGIREKGVITKWADALKAWETLPFIKANPANAIRNVVNNDITLIGRGVYGTMTPNAIKNFWKGKWVPPQFTRSFGLAGDELTAAAKAGEDFNAGNAVKQLTDILEGKGGLATKVKSAAEGIDLKAMDFSKFSAKWERDASIRASTNGWMEFHQKYWNPRTGFTSIAKSLDAQTLERMEEAIPGISEVLDDIAQQAGGDSTKFAELLQTNIEHNIPAVFRNASDRVGFKVEDVFGAELTHTLQEGLPKAIQEGTVHQFVDGVRSQMEAHVDELFTKHVENLPGIIQAQVQAGGPMQFHRIFGKAVDELWGGNIEHSHRMSTINELLEYGRQSGDYSKVSGLWQKIKADGDAHFTRVWKKFDAYQQGLKDGAKAAGIKYPDEVAQSFKDVENGWKSFIEFRNKSYEEVFGTENKFAKKSLEQVQATIDAEFKKIVKSEDELYQRIDDMMVQRLPDPVQRKMYKNWRDKAAQLRVSDKEKTAKFFEQVRHARRDEVPAMWQKYWQEKMNRVEQMRQLDSQGSAAIQGDEAATAQFFSEVPTGEPQNIYELASRYDIPSATKNGARNERRVLSTVNKYAKETSATDVQIVQNAKLPDDVKTTFAAWDEAKKAVKEAQKSGDELDVRQAAILAAKNAEKEARQAYNDALAANKIDAAMVDKLVKERTFMDVENIPMNVAQEAFEAQVKSKTAKVATAAKEQELGFMPDAEKIFKDPLPLETGLSELNYGRSYAAIDALTEEAVTTASKKSRLLSELDPALQKKVMQWGEKVSTEANSFRAAGVQYAAYRRDSALLNYNRRTEFDTMLGNIAPFAFWTTHSVFNWAVHSLDRPAMLTSYLRMKQLFETAGLPDQNVPKRLKGNIRVPLPFTPEWMGDTFVNPGRFLLPFDGFAQPWEQMTQAKYTQESKTKQTLEQMLEKGIITEDEYTQAIEEKGGDVWEMALEQVKEGGEGYDAMDFATMLTTPHAPLMWAYNAMRGTKNEIGPFTPMTRTAKNVATMLGVDDWSNHPYNIEARVRRSMGLPAYDRWDDYRVARQISNLAADGNFDYKAMREAMEVAALVEAGKMTSKEAVANNKMYAEATKRANIESAGGWSGTLLSMLGIPVRAYPEGEQKQRELAEEFSRAIQAREKGDPEALTKFFDENPEYESRLSLFKSPEERIKSFMVDNIWSKWNSLPKVTKDEIREQLGNNFQTYFLDKETQSYDALTPEQLNMYLKLMGGRTVGKLSTTEEVMAEFNQLKLTEPETAWRVENFYNSRTSDFPDWYKLQEEYYNLPDGSKAREKFRRENSQLREYWDYRRSWMEKNPDLVRFLTDDEKQLKKYERMTRDPGVAVPTAEEIRANFSPETVEVLQSGSVPPVMNDYLKELASQYGITVSQLTGILGVQP